MKLLLLLSSCFFFVNAFTMDVMINILPENEEEKQPEEISKVTGVCYDGDTMHQLNEEWDNNDDIVNKCDPKTFKVIAVGCRGRNGTIVAIGSSSTDKVFVEEDGERFNIFTTISCQSEANGTITKDVKMRLQELPPKEEGCEEKLTNGTSVAKKPGDEWYGRGHNNTGLLELRCDVDDKGRKTTTVLGCLTNDNIVRIIPLGETKDFGIFDRRRMRCRPTEDGKAELENIEIVYKCDNGRKLREEWRELPFVKACVADPLVADGPSPIVIIRACLFNNITIPVGETRNIEGGECNCKRVDERPIPSGREHLIPVLDAIAECEQTGPSVLADPATMTKDQSTTAKQVARTDRAMTLGQSLANDIKDANLTLQDVPLKEEGCEVKLANGTSVLKNPKDEWRDTVFSYRCNIDDSGRKNITVIGCWCMESSSRNYVNGQFVALGKTIDLHYPHRRRICASTEDGKAKLEEVEIVYRCDNGKKLKEEWREESFVKACVEDPRVEDGPNPIAVIRACIFNNTTISVGETRKIEFGECSCKRKDKHLVSAGYEDLFPVLEAVAVCEQTGQALAYRADPKTTNAPATTKM